jgi:hypothetical protein
VNRGRRFSKVSRGFRHLSRNALLERLQSSVRAQDCVVRGSCRGGVRLTERSASCLEVSDRLLMTLPQRFPFVSKPELEVMNPVRRFLE